MLHPDFSKFSLTLREALRNFYYFYAINISMGQPLSIENADWTYLITTRTAGSKLWLINNPALEKAILGCLAKYQERYGVIIYGFIIMGNHYHLMAKFPLMNRALFMRDFNSAVARIVGRMVRQHGRRSLWARRYSWQVLLDEEDIKNWFFYIALNPVSSGITSSINQYPSYNSFEDAINLRSKKYTWVDWSAYLVRKSYDTKARPADFAREYELTYSPIPGEYNAYSEQLRTELQIRENNLRELRKSKGLGFLGIKKILLQSSGISPRTTKSSTRSSYRPLILTLSSETKRKFLETYFHIVNLFKEASLIFRTTNTQINFPNGTYLPPKLIPALQL